MDGTKPGVVGKKFDDGKPRWELMPLDAAEEIVRVLTFGARKYGDCNWQHVKPRTRHLGAVLRHITQRFFKGEILDSESGIPHLAHAACSLLFLLWFDMHDKDLK